MHLQVCQSLSGSSRTSVGNPLHALTVVISFPEIIFKFPLLPLKTIISKAACGEQRGKCYFLSQGKDCKISHLIISKTFPLEKTLKAKETLWKYLTEGEISSLGRLSLSGQTKHTQLELVRGCKTTPKNPQISSLSLEGVWVWPRSQKVPSGQAGSWRADCRPGDLVPWMFPSWSTENVKPGTSSSLSTALKFSS